ncbi:hypothetical protein SteCoe_8824 [Stentor coeruleus]|uniref:Uncharacterized protein n=1 Tax=Stentor coeruleus TaxID=5963 RepID=A0A1R2CJH2_9CILI|nr:hypothetical protein SteCoe_8824 [Stentor coeruleus]
MRSCIKYLRSKANKPIPKRGSPEYLEMQKKIIERRSTTLSASEPIKHEAVPKFYKYALAASSMPSTIGVFFMLYSEPFSAMYMNSLALTGTWIGISTATMNGYLIALEAFLYKLPEYQDMRNFLFVGRSRMFWGYSGIPMGLLCIYSTISYNWGGLFFFFTYLLANTLGVIRASERGIVPNWFGNSHWPWLMQTQLIVVFLIYSLLSSQAKISRS